MGRFDLVKAGNSRNWEVFRPRIADSARLQETDFVVQLISLGLSEPGNFTACIALVLREATDRKAGPFIIGRF